MTPVELTDELEAAYRANEAWARAHAKLLGFLLAAKVCSECGSPATWEIYPAPSGPNEPRCDEHKRPMIRMNRDPRPLSDGPFHVAEWTMECRGCREGLERAPIGNRPEMFHRFDQSPSRCLNDDSAGDRRELFANRFVNHLFQCWLEEFGEGHVHGMAQAAKVTIEHYLITLRDRKADGITPIPAGQSRA